MNLYQNTIDGFSIVNKYPVTSLYNAALQRKLSWNLKLNQQLRFNNGTEVQLAMVYLAPDIIPQGEIGSRFSLDLGLKKPMKYKKRHSNSINSYLGNGQPNPEYKKFINKKSPSITDEDFEL
jgi:hypothetical protein